MAETEPPAEPPMAIDVTVPFDRIDLMVQKPIKSGDAIPQMGTIGVCLARGGDGQPRLLVELQHADGTALCGSLQSGEYAGLMVLLSNAGVQAYAIATGEPGPKPN